ncbi:MAG: hypothetical protein ACPGVP_21845 [Thiolinea sp.]
MTTAKPADQQKTYDTKESGMKLASCPEPVIGTEDTKAPESPCVKEDAKKKKERDIA